MESLQDLIRQKLVTRSVGSSFVPKRKCTSKNKWCIVKMKQIILNNRKLWV